MAYAKKDLISTKDLSKEDILDFLNDAKKFKKINLQNVKKLDFLRGVTSINAFLKTRQGRGRVLRSPLKG